MPRGLTCSAVPVHAIKVHDHEIMLDQSELQFPLTFPVSRKTMYVRCNFFCFCFFGKILKRL